MATVNKNFKVKHGLVVEGTTGTINGEDILTKSEADIDYIIDQVGGSGVSTNTPDTLVLRDENGNFAAGDITVNELSITDVGRIYGDENGDLVIANVDGADVEINANDFRLNATDDIRLEGVDFVGITSTNGEIEFNAPDGNVFINGDGPDDRVVVRGTVNSLIGDNTVDGTSGNTVSDRIASHASATTGVHGVTGDVVGTTDAQDLSNKRIIDTLYFTDGVTISDEAEIAVRAGSHDFDVQANEGDLHLKTVATGADVQITSDDGDILLNANGAAYYGSASAGNEIATHGYVDNAISGLTWKQSVNLLYDAAIPVLSGSGATQLIVDGHDVLGDADSGYRLLLTGATSPGIYVYNSTSGSWTLTRSEDADAFGELIGAAVYVMEGTQYGSTSWVQGNHYLTDFTGQSWTQFSGQGSVTAGSGITVDGLEVSIDRTTVDDWYDANGAAATALQDAKDYADALDTDDIEEGGTNFYFTDTRAKISAADLITSATKTNITITGDENGLTITAENGVADSTTSDLAEGTNLYFTDYRARTAIIPGVGVSLNTATGYIDANLGTGLETDGSNQIQIDRTDVDTWYDANGAAAAAQTAAEGYADGLAGNYEVAGAAAAAQAAAEGYADGLAANYDPAGSAATAETDARNYADELIGDVTVDGTSGNTVTARIASAVSGLVDSAPELLNTLNELAEALQDNPDVISDLQDLAAGKQDTLTAGANIDITGATISVTGLDTDDVSEGTNLYFTDARAVDALEAVVPNFTEVDINSVATQVAATGSATAATATTVYSFAKADYRSAKFLVKVAYSTHTEISEVLLTLDTSDNIAITEYAIVGTNGTLSAVSAAVSGANVNLLVTPTNTSTVTVMGTLLA
jgi:predicted GNAT family acetyltransferase